LSRARTSGHFRGHGAEVGSPDRRAAKTARPGLRGADGFQLLDTSLEGGGDRAGIGKQNGPESPIITLMVISPHWYRENANACAWRAEQSRDPLVKAAYKEMVRAWLILAASAEELVRYPPREARTEEQALAA
jgi:hypothetical protein